MPVTPVHGKKGSFSLNSIDLSGWFNSIDFPETIEPAETTTFQPPGDAKTFIVGLKSYVATLEGLWDATVDADLATIDSGGVAVPFIYGPAGSTTGFVKLTGNALLTKFDIKTPVGGVVTISIELQISGAVTRTVF